MTNLERVENMYNLILPLVCAKKVVTVKTKFFFVDFFSEEVCHMRTDTVTAKSEYLHDLFDLVKYTIERTSLCDDIEILLDGEVFAVINDDIEILLDGEVFAVIK